MAVCSLEVDVFENVDFGVGGGGLALVDPAVYVSVSVINIISSSFAPLPITILIFTPEEHAQQRRSAYKAGHMPHPATGTCAKSATSKPLSKYPQLWSLTLLRPELVTLYAFFESTPRRTLPLLIFARPDAVASSSLTYCAKPPVKWESSSCNN